MLTHRTSVLALAAIATLALAASTDAEASPFCHRGGFASFSRAYVPVAPQQRIVSAKPRFEAARTAKRYRSGGGRHQNREGSSQGCRNTCQAGE